jgi:hypothetical protein
MVLPKRAYAQVPAVDANGWQVAYQGDGKRRWRKRWLAQAAPAAIFGTISDNLPAGVATIAAVDVYASVTTRTTGWLNANFTVIPRPRMDQTAAGLTLDYVSSSSVTNINAFCTTLDVFCELVER